MPAAMFFFLWSMAFLLGKRNRKSRLQFDWEFISICHLQSFLLYCSHVTNRSVAGRIRGVSAGKKKRRPSDFIRALPSKSPRRPFESVGFDQLTQTQGFVFPYGDRKETPKQCSKPNKAAFSCLNCLNCFLEETYTVFVTRSLLRAVEGGVKPGSFGDDYLKYHKDFPSLAPCV